MHTVIKDLGKIFAYGALAMLDARHHGLKKARQATSLLKKKQRNPHRSAVIGLQLPTPKSAQQVTQDIQDQINSDLKLLWKAKHKKPTQQITNKTPLNIPTSIHATFQPLHNKSALKPPTAPPLIAITRHKPKISQTKITTFINTRDTHTHTGRDTVAEADIGTRHVISKEDQNLIDRYIQLGDTTDVAFNPSGHRDTMGAKLYPMTTKEIRNYLVTDDQHCLTGDNINNICDIINKDSPAEGAAGSYFFISTRLMQQLYHEDKYDYAQVKNVGKARGTYKGNNLLKYDTLYVPFNFSGGHWTGAIVSLKNKKIIYKDSLWSNIEGKKSGRQEIHVLKRWLRDEIQRRRWAQGGEGISKAEIIRLGRPTEWETLNIERTNIRQTNVIDCGVCYIANMLYDTQSRIHALHIAHIPLIRKQLFLLLMQYNHTSTHMPLYTPAPHNTHTHIHTHDNTIFENYVEYVLTQEDMTSQRNTHTERTLTHLSHTQETDTTRTQYTQYTETSSHTSQTHKYTYAQRHIDKGRYGPRPDPIAAGYTPSPPRSPVHTRTHITQHAHTGPHQNYSTNVTHTHASALTTHTHPHTNNTQLSYTETPLSGTGVTPLPSLSSVHTRKHASTTQHAQTGPPQNYSAKVTHTLASTPISHTHPHANNTLLSSTETPHSGMGTTPLPSLSPVHTRKHASHDDTQTDPRQGMG